MKKLITGSNIRISFRVVLDRIGVNTMQKNHKVYFFIILQTAKDPAVNVTGSFVSILL